ncbi:uncharacterized protein [Drosophila tropicalis]|uniref:uncharacterized protein n=1 Tax=Drosophila tropicalis TaxID=46794 RepID=UPI0035AC1C43
MTTETDTKPNNSTASLMQLNDDVLALIVRYLNVYQQFQLAQLHSRLSSIVQMLWRTRIRNVGLEDEMFRRSATSSKEFLEFILALGPYMQGLSCHGMDVRRLRYLSNQTLSGITSFEWMAETQRRGRIRFVDEDVRLLRRVFPSLRKLKLRGCQITGKYLCDLELLNELSLDDCQFLESQYFPDIFRQLQLRKFDIMEDCDEVNCCDLVDLQLCPTLEHIKIADYHLCMESDFTQQLLQLPRLHKLSIYSRNFVFDVLSRIARPNNLSPGGELRGIIGGRQQEIEGFRFSGLLHDYGRFFRELSNLRQLQRLELHGLLEEGQDQLQCLEDQALVQLSTKLPALTELHLCGYQLESPAGILEFIIHCRQLKILNITRSKCLGDALVWRSLGILTKQKWRHEPMRLWIGDSDINPEIIHSSRYLDNERLLRIETKRLSHNEDYMNGVLKFCFVR